MNKFANQSASQSTGRSNIIIAIHSYNPNKKVHEIDFSSLSLSLHRFGFLSSLEAIFGKQKQNSMI